MQLRITYHVSLGRPNEAPSMRYFILLSMLTAQALPAQSLAGPVRVRLTKRDGAVVAVRTYVGGRWAAAGGEVTDLGTVSSREAAALLLAIAERSGGRGEDAIFPATL